MFEGSLGLCEESVKPLWNNETWNMEGACNRTIFNENYHFVHIRITSFPLGLEV